MRSWVLIAALAVICLGAEPELSHKERIRKVLKSWNPANSNQLFHPVSEQKIQFDEQSDLFVSSRFRLTMFHIWFQVDTHHISKRSIAEPHVFAGMATRGCNKPGYTGATCQYRKSDHICVFKLKMQFLSIVLCSQSLHS